MCNPLIHQKQKQKTESFEQTLLWAHQTQWQREMLTKYSNTMSLIDATYKTTLYDVPLFFIAVRTNAGYVVAAEFIVQSEASQYIEEAINIVKKWNPEWNQNILYSDAEILTLESAFPKTTVYLCDFHREQARERWVKDHKHGLTMDEGTQLLDLLCDCAWASPSQPGDGKQLDYFYLQAVDRLKKSQIWLQHEQVRIWLSTTWLSIPQVYKHVG